MSVTRQLRKALYENRHGDDCERCGRYISPGFGSLHHRRPRKMGGSKDPATDDPANLVYICGSGVTLCHGEIESNREQAITEGWLVKDAYDPRTIPVWRYGTWQMPTATGWIPYPALEFAQ